MGIGSPNQTGRIAATTIQSHAKIGHKGLAFLGLALPKEIFCNLSKKGTFMAPFTKGASATEANTRLAIKGKGNNATTKGLKNENMLSI